VASDEWREKDQKRLNTEDTEEEAQRTQRRVEEFKVEGSKGRAAAEPRNSSGEWREEKLGTGNFPSVPRHQEVV
jgi:hypothetical protein